MNREFRKGLSRDSNGNYFLYEELDLDWKEKEKIRSEINTSYRRYNGVSIGVHVSYGLDDKAYEYYFENHGFDDINIFMRMEHGEE